MMDRGPNAGIRELCRLRMGLNERIDEGMVCHVERMERDRIAKRSYVGECAGGRSVGIPRNR